MHHYSRTAIPNRLAVEGEELVIHRFGTRFMGLASPLDLEPVLPRRGQPKSFWARLKLRFQPPKTHSVPAVCIPPGARLVLEDIPKSLQAALGVGPIELVTFTEIAPTNGPDDPFAALGSQRDAVRFRHGREVPLQDLCEGLPVWVMHFCGTAAPDGVQEMIS